MALVSPRSTNQERRNKEFILNILLVTGWLLMAVFSLVIVFISILVLRYDYLITNLLSIAAVALVLFLLFILSKKGYFEFSALLLIAGFFIMSTYMVVTYGILLPQGVLLFALTIVMSGILLTSTASFVTAGLTSVILVLTSLLHTYEIIKPDLAWHTIPASIGDALGLVATFFAITIVSWLMYRQMQRSLQRAEASEQALKEHNEMLEVRVRERTKELHKAQMEKLNQLHKFAELGYTTTALFHDLANRITVLSMDVESLSDKRNDKEEIIQQTNESIRYIEDLIRQVRLQVMEHETPMDFEILEETDDVIQTLSYKNKRQKSKISIQSNIPKNTRYYGDRVVFRQIIGCLVSNAIDSYDSSAAQGKEKVVDIMLDRSDQDYTIHVRDYGPGIIPKDMPTIFEPFYTTKKHGMGIGLFISKQLTEQQLHGTLAVESHPGKGTTFTLKLPRKKKDAKSS